MEGRAKLKTAARWRAEDVALFLDLDGTLTPLVETPGETRADETCRAALRQARDRLGGRIAILSGRPIARVDEILAGAVTCVGGVHGLERRDALGQVFATPPHARVAHAASVLQALANATKGLLVETKGASVAVHFRQAPEAEAAVVEAVERLAQGSGLEIQFGKAVAELRTPGPNKATALHRFMLEAPFAGARPIFLGDDLTDEPAFAQARALGGAGILVGAARPTEAQGRLGGPAEVLAWITRGVESGQFDLEAAQWAA